MKRHSLRALFTALAVAVTSALLLTGCPSTKKDDDEDDRPSSKKRTGGGGGGKKAEALKPIAAKERGVIKGVVKWKDGADLPDRDALTKALHREMAKQDHAYCTAAEAKEYEKEQYDYRINTKTRGLGNVFVWIEPAEAGYFFEVPKEQLEKIPKTVTMHQPHCSFVPHAMVIFPNYYNKDGRLEKSGQTFVLENDATVTHNAKVQGGPLTGDSFNQTMEARKPGGEPRRLPLDFIKPEKKEVAISCDIHKWMRAYVRAFTHPYAAVTSVGAEPAKKVWENLDSANVGTYEIEGVPVGAKVKLYVWHEKEGFLVNGKDLTLKKENVENFEAGK